MADEDVEVTKSMKSRLLPEKTRGDSEEEQVDPELAGKSVVSEEEATEEADDTTGTNNNLTVVTDLESYEGDSLEAKIDDFIATHPVAMISRSLCAFCRDVKDLLGNQLGVKVHVLEVNVHPQGGKIFAYIKNKYDHKTVPVIFVKGEYIGGCDSLKALHAKKELESNILSGLITKERTFGTDKLETSGLVPVDRSLACHPLFWFPNVVNNYIIRVVGFQVCALSTLSAYFYDEIWGQWIAVGLLIDFMLRLVAGSSASPLGMIAALITSPFRPQFRPGPPKQFAAACGVMFSGLGVVFYFAFDFNKHEYVGLAFMAGLAGASGMEWALDFCLGCKFYAIGIYLGLIPDHVYRIYTSSRQETEDSWDYMYGGTTDKHEPPVKITTGPSPIALQYKKKTDEWTKDDFHIVRNMQVSYFSAPLALAALAVAFKMGTEWPQNLGFATAKERATVLPEYWYQITAVISAVLFVLFLGLYSARAILYPHKIATEWNCPLRSPSFGTIAIYLMLFSFLFYDEEANEGREDIPEVTSRVLFWIGAVAHALLTIAKMGEWIGLRLEMEHFHAQWMILPVGLAVAGLVAPVIPAFAEDSENAVGNAYLARFFNSFAQLMAITLFVLSFFKVVTTHNSDTRIRHGIWIWLAAPCVLGLSNFVICTSDAAMDITLSLQQCANGFSNYYFIGIFLFFGICFSSLPHLGFLGNDVWGMSYWIGCFSLSALAACGSLFYALTNFNAARTLEFIFLSAAAIANVVCFLHTMTGIARKRGVFTPEAKWGPLSFMKLTHEAFRGNMATMREALQVLQIKKGDNNKEQEDNLNIFAAHLNRFSILHDEHTKHEDQVIFKTFNDWFHDHAKQYNNDHEDYHKTFAQVVPKANVVLNRSLSVEERQNALDFLKKILPPFFADFEEHLRGEEDNLVSIGRKYLPLELQKQIARKVWELSPADRWEIIIPFVINNLPRHGQRVKYIKVLLWSSPERAQQIGMIVYRNVDAVMWERLRVMVPEMIPRGASNWRRYY